MRKHDAVLFACLLLFSASFSQISLGIGGGFTLSDVKNASQLTSDNSLVAGYQFTVFVEHSFTKYFKLRPALQVAQKGYKVVLENGHQPFFVYWKRELSSTYLEVPLNFIYQMPVGKAHLVLGSGPVFSYGLYGRRETTLIESDHLTPELHTSIDIEKNTFANRVNKRFDFGWNLLAGARYRRYTLQGSYNYGLTGTTRDDDPKLKNRSFSIIVGYFMKP